MTETIAQFYEKDHDRLDKLFQDFQGLKHLDFPKAKEAFVAFRQGLLRHIEWEEGILFPFFETRTGMRDAGPTFVMTMEHREIKSALEAVHEKVRNKDPNSGVEDSALLSLLSMHNLKEERILYPAIDRAVDDAERRKIFERMEAAPIEPAGACCGSS
jgi:regulator of cell morphogenesis and NO signaling